MRKFKKMGLFVDFNIYYTSETVSPEYLLTHFEIVIDNTELQTDEDIAEYLTDGKKYEYVGIYIKMDIQLHNNIANAIAYISSFARNKLYIYGLIGTRSMKINGPIFQHCNARKLTLRGIYMDKMGCSSVNVEKLVIHDEYSSFGSNPYLSYCTCKHLKFKHCAEINFPPFPVMLESLIFKESLIGTCVVAELPFLKKLAVNESAVLILNELHNLDYLSLDTKKLYIQEDIAKGISSLSSDNSNRFNIRLLEIMSNIQSYSVGIYTKEQAIISQQLKHLSAVEIRTSVDNLSQDLESIELPYEEPSTIEAILKARPSIKRVTSDLNDIDIIKQFPNVEFLPYFTSKIDKNTEIHNARARNRTMTLSSLTE